MWFWVFEKYKIVRVKNIIWLVNKWLLRVNGLFLFFRTVHTPNESEYFNIYRVHFPFKW